MDDIAKAKINILRRAPVREPAGGAFRLMGGDDVDGRRGKLNQRIGNGLGRSGVNVPRFWTGTRKKRATAGPQQSESQNRERDGSQIKHEISPAGLLLHSPRKIAAHLKEAEPIFQWRRSISQTVTNLAQISVAVSKEGTSEMSKGLSALILW